MKGRGHLEDLIVDVSVIFMDHKEINMKMLTGLVYFMIG
jgi:hypothetical protein